MDRRFAIALMGAFTLAACSHPAASPNDAGADAAGKAFLAKNAGEKDIHVTKSGLQYRILQSGPTNGLRPHLADDVKVNYEGKLLDGEVFDSSYERGAPAVMTVRDLVPGWREALQLMHPGDQWLIYLPPALGYGAEGKGPIPPNSVLVFKLELIDVLPDASSMGTA